MSRRARLIVATLAVVASFASACGLDDGARVRNQDNVRDSSEIDS